jgi:uncharacterized LabA/DUF88 family protein
MEKRVCVFVDGENFRYAINELFSDIFDKTEYIPHNGKWSDLFDLIVNKASHKQGARLRAYWYVIQNLDYYPYKFPNPAIKYDEVKNLLSEFKPFREELDKITDRDESIEKMKELINELKIRKDIMRERFDFWTRLQEYIARVHDSIEFRRAGSNRYRLFDKTMGREKAVDVKLATDLIILSDIYDIAVIVSGDQDYVPAVQVIKDQGKKVVNVAFLTRGGQLLPGGAKRLNQETDWSLEIPYDELKSYLFPPPTP